MGVFRRPYNYALRSSRLRRAPYGVVAEAITRSALVTGAGSVVAAQAVIKPRSATVTGAGSVVATQIVTRPRTATVTGAGSVVAISSIKIVRAHD